jgi:hypothetical protein
MVEENRTYHLGSMLKIHNSAAVDNFCTLMHIAYEASRGWLPGTFQWWEIISRVAVPIIGTEQKEDFECGYIAIFFLWQYLHM